MSEPSILLDVQDGCAVITLNRPDQLNSFNVEMHALLRDALGEVEARDDIRVAAAHRRRPRLLRRAGSVRPRGRRRTARRADLGFTLGHDVQPAGAPPARAADAGRSPR